MLTKIIIGFVILLIVLQVAVASRLTLAGAVLATLAVKGEILEEKNELLEKKIATFSSLLQIAQRAKEAGFVKAQPFYLMPELPVAFKNENVEVAR